MKIKSVSAIVETLADTTGANVLEVIGALTGVCFDEEDAGRIRSYLSDGPANPSRVQTDE